MVPQRLSSSRNVIAVRIGIPETISERAAHAQLGSHPLAFTYPR
jgi:hypothetical protein